MARRSAALIGLLVVLLALAACAPAPGGPTAVWRRVHGDPHADY